MSGSAKDRLAPGRTNLPRALLAGIACAALAALLLELALQLAARFSEDRSGAWRSGATHRILVVGDSHAYGAFVAPERSLPAQLQRLLDERAPGRHSVLNRGVPGMNSAQVRNRLPVWLSRHAPDLVVVWVGINNSWNVAEVERAPGAGSALLSGLATHSRLYRLVRVWLHDRRLERVVAGADWEVVGVEGALGDVERWRVRQGGREERIAHLRQTAPPSYPRGILQRPGLPLQRVADRRARSPHGPDVGPR